MWKTVREQIATLISGISGMQEVSNTPKLDFAGYPSAYIVPSDVESDYETTTENERVYAFLVRAFYETKTVGIATAMDRLEVVADNIIDAIDNEDKLNSGRTIAVGLPANYTFLSIEATPSVWGQISGSELLMAEMRVRIHISYDAS